MHLSGRRIDFPVRQENIIRIIQVNEPSVGVSSSRHFPCGAVNIRFSQSLPKHILPILYFYSLIFKMTGV